MEFRTRYSKALKVKMKIYGPSRAKQSFRDECDVNNILKRYQQTGIMPHVRAQIAAQYGDFSEIGDFAQALQTVMHGQEAFEAMPALVRDRFQNDPEKFVAFCLDPKNQDELIELGLADRKPGAKPPGVPAVPEQKSPTPPAAAPAS